MMLGRGSWVIQPLCWWPELSSQLVVSAGTIAELRMGVPLLQGIDSAAILLGAEWLAEAC